MTDTEYEQSTEDEETKALRQLAAVAGDRAVHIDDREVFGIYPGEDEVSFESQWFGALRCRLFGHAGLRHAPVLDGRQECIGGADFCTRCGAVLNKEVVNRD